jgi:hypothetical protein
MRVRDFRVRIPDRGPMILYRIALTVAVAVGLVMQWQTRADGKAKDKWETKGCVR